MAAGTTFSVIYLGKLDPIDPTEGEQLENRYRADVDAENADELVGMVFDELRSASTQTFSAGEYDSRDTSGFTITYNQDNTYRGDDTFNITDSQGNTTEHVFDATAYYRAQITYGDDTTDNVQLVIFQDTEGNTWIAPPNSQYSPNAAKLGADPIQRIEITGLINNRYPGLAATREQVEIVTVPCFTVGTMIETDRGAVAVEQLRVGDLVRTADHGMQPLRWIGQRKLTATELAAAPKLRPIRIGAGALGGGRPERDLVVSPQHRVLVRSKIAQRLFDANEVLVAAKQLLPNDGIDVVEDEAGVTYVHVMFDQHEVIFANGAATESLYAGPEALRAIDAAGVDELQTLFPELRSGARPAPARHLASGRKARKLAMRHAQNNKPLLM
ncbi:Hint domain-containing protein [Paracoccaceae bacterium GXU_MW_L88]